MVTESSRPRSARPARLSPALVRVRWPPPAGRIVALTTTKEVPGARMPHHLTRTSWRRDGPEPPRRDGKCLAAGVPIVHGRIYRTLFDSVLCERATRRAGASPGA
jgi:hypothetical protein